MESINPLLYESMLVTGHYNYKTQPGCMYSDKPCILLNTTNIVMPKLPAVLTYISDVAQADA
jgi:hypothetical protein